MRLDQVSVFFSRIIDLPDGTYRVVEGSEFVVTREVRRGEEGAGKNGAEGAAKSIYRINDKGTTWKDVREKLSTHGIDLAHNRFLILQGEVEQIAMMKAKGATPTETGLLEYIEDIIGSNRLVEPLEEVRRLRRWPLGRADTLERRANALPPSVACHLACRPRLRWRSSTSSVRSS